MHRIFILGGFANSLINFRGDLISDLISRGFDVHVCAPDANDDICSKLESMGTTYHPISLSRAGVNPVKDIATTRELIGLLREIKPDYFLAYTIKPVIFGSIAAKIAGVNKIYSIITGLGFLFTSNEPKAKVLNSVVSILYKISLSYNNGVFFQNCDDRDVFLKKKIATKKSSLKIINGSGVNLDRYNFAPLPQNTSFIFIGRLVKEKGVREFICASRAVGEKYPETQFYVAGGMDSNPGSISQDVLDDLIFGGDITYLGDLPDVRDAIRDSTVLVLPSYREGTPRTVLEAMAMGRVIITTDAPGCRETVIEPSNGLLVEPKSASSLVIAMERIINSEKSELNRMGAMSRKLAEEKYDVRKVNKEILSTMGLCQKND